jgi:hypothetical protein
LLRVSNLGDPNVEVEENIEEAKQNYSNAWIIFLKDLLGNTKQRKNCL